MQILDLVQGSEQWKAERLKAFTASEAPIMMGASPYMSRDDLLTYKTTGDEQAISRFQQIIFDKGHASEATARPLAEVRCFDGDELFPLTGVLMVDGMRLLASFDGIVMPAQDASWEHKQFNKELYELVKSGGELEPKHYWQLEHQALVGGLEKIVFTVSDGTDDNKADLIYHSRPVRRAELIAHWKQFDIDLQGYVPQVFTPKPVAEPVPALPSITYKIDLSKGIAIHSNLDAFKLAAQELVKMSECELVTDQDFENAKERIKECEKAEKNIASLVERVLGELGDANKFKQDMESIKEWIRKSRLNQSNKVAARDKDRRREIMQDGSNALAAFIASINEKLSPIVLPLITADFAAAIKGKSKFENMISAVNDEVARAKVEASQLAEKIEQERKAEAARQQTQSLPQQVSLQDVPATNSLIPDDYADYAAQLSQEHNSQNELPLSQPAHSPMYVATKEMQEEFEEVFVDLGDYQKGFSDGRIAGLELALKLFEREGSMGFIQACKDFIAVGAEQAVSEAA